MVRLFTAIHLLYWWVFREDLCSFMLIILFLTPDIESVYFLRVVSEYPRFLSSIICLLDKHPLAKYASPASTQKTSTGLCYEP
jgi:hypothetical protein